VLTVIHIKSVPFTSICALKLAAGQWSVTIKTTECLRQFISHKIFQTQHCPAIHLSLCYHVKKSINHSDM